MEQTRSKGIAAAFRRETVVRPVIFIHTNRKQLVGARVAAHSMKRSSRFPEAFDVRILEAESYPELTSRHGKEYTREGKRVRWDQNDLQSFTPLRFLPPSEMGFRGRALVTDPDVFAVADVWPLLSMD